MKQKKWNIPLTGPRIPQALLEGGFSPLLCQILTLRGITTAQQARSLLFGGKETLHDPLLMLGMK